MIQVQLPWTPLAFVFFTATLGEESVTLALKAGDKARGASLDRFGLFTGHRGGSFVRIYVDDLKYTAARPAR
jgi:hypothetical protein